jgi:excisionase family DNA binding protein
VIAADNAHAISPKHRRMDGSSSPTQDQRALLTASEVAQLLAVPTSWVYAQSRAGRIPTVTCGRYRRYRRSAIEALITELEQAGRQ